ncbi:MAG: isoprenylcysteine carboxylmethyltransferase family protein [Opitutaceae bacterium]|nr:isoprenylcysteine carboxylmethyltransferase family protein [Opitutaceae bacterium]
MPLMEELNKSGNFLFRWRSYLPLLFVVVAFASVDRFQYIYGSHVLDLYWEAFCLLVGALGIVLRVFTVAFVPGSTSGRGTEAPSASRLNTTGMYSIMRNPLYLGNFLLYLAPVLFMRIWWVMLIFALVFIIYYERIIFAEETFLRKKFSAEYMNWAARTPVFFPKPSLWVKPDRVFSWKMALTREYHGVYGLILAMFLMEFSTDLYLTGHFVLDDFWLGLLAAGTLFYLTVRLLKKKTQILAIP